MVIFYSYVKEPEGTLTHLLYRCNISWGSGGGYGVGLWIILDKLWISYGMIIFRKKGEFLEVHCKFGRSKSDLTWILMWGLGS